jgi:hypothetical protein
MLKVSDGTLVNEQQLEPDDEAEYEFSITNECDCIGMRNIRIAFEVDVIDGGGGGLEFSPNPYIVEETLGPGGSIGLTITIKTTGANAGPRTIKTTSTYEPVLISTAGDAGQLAVTVSPD